MSQTILLTIITITKDDPEGLARTLKSTQGWRELPWVEQVVVFAGDDNSVVADSSVRMLPQQSQGIAGAFNEGLAAAQGEWVWFLNGGDAIHESLDPQWLCVLLRNTQAGVVTGALHYDGEELPLAAPPLRLQWPLVTSWLPHPATLIRTKALKEVGGFQPCWKIGMDYDLWYRLLSRDTKVDVIALPLARFDRTGISNRPENRTQLLEENAAVIWRHKAIMVKTGWYKTRRLVNVFWEAAKSRWL